VTDLKVCASLNSHTLFRLGVRLAPPQPPIELKLMAARADIHFREDADIVKQEEDGMLNASQNEAANSGTIDPDAPDGVYLDDLAEGVVLEVETRGHRYTIVNRTRGEALISGHPRFCPQPTVVVIGGSGLGGCLLKAGFIGLGMRLTFQLPTHRTITTSPIIQIRTSPPLPRP